MSVREQSARVAAVNCDYELAKAEAVRAGHPTRVSVRLIERRHNLKAGQLVYFRANLPRRKTPVPDSWD